MRSRLSDLFHESVADFGVLRRLFTVTKMIHPDLTPRTATWSQVTISRIFPVVIHLRAEVPKENGTFFCYESCTVSFLDIKHPEFQIYSSIQLDIGISILILFNTVSWSCKVFKEGRSSTFAIITTFAEVFRCVYPCSEHFNPGTGFLLPREQGRFRWFPEKLFCLSTFIHPWTPTKNFDHQTNQKKNSITQFYLFSFQQKKWWHSQHLPPDFSANPFPPPAKKNNIHPSFTGFQRLCSRTPSRSYFSISSTSSWRYSFHCRGSSCVAPLNGWNLTLINFNKHLQTQRSNCGEEKKRHVS